MMDLDEFETILSALMAQYTEACAEEIAAVETEVQCTRRAALAKTTRLSAAYQAGEITGRNAEIRALECEAALACSSRYSADVAMADRATLDRKAATMRRVGIEHEIKLWRAWLASQSRGD